jgi:hypothetical protein
MSYGFRVYKRDLIPAGAAQSATYSELTSGTGYETARAARDAAAQVTAPSYESAGPDHATGYVHQVFVE